MKNINFLLFILFFPVLQLKAQGTDSPADLTITIGTQVWTATNLNVSTFRNGESIPEAETDKEWEKASKEQSPAWCNYERKTENGTLYGKLYNWYAVHDSRGLAPAGCHIPSDSEWTILVKFLGGDSLAGLKMRSKTLWNCD